MREINRDNTQDIRHEREMKNKSPDKDNGQKEEKTTDIKSKNIM